jgi:hypothetical protein
VIICLICSVVFICLSIGGLLLARSIVCPQTFWQNCLG